MFSAAASGASYRAPQDDPRLAEVLAGTFGHPTLSAILLACVELSALALALDAVRRVEAPRGWQDWLVLLTSCSALVTCALAFTKLASRLPGIPFG